MDNNPNELPSYIRLWRRIRADTIIWILIAGLCFAACAVLTHIITHVDNRDDIHFISFEGPTEGPTKVKSPSITFSPENGKLEIDEIDSRLKNIRIDPISQDESKISCDVGVVHGMHGVGHLEPATMLEGLALAAADGPNREFGFYSIDVAQLYKQIKEQGLDNNSLAAISCIFPADFVEDETFTSRKFAINVKDVGANGEAFKTLVTGGKVSV